MSEEKLELRLLFLELMLRRFIIHIGIKNPQIFDSFIQDLALPGFKADMNNIENSKTIETLTAMIPQFRKTIIKELDSVKKH